MVVSELSVCKNNKKRSNIYIDGEFVFACDRELIAEYGLGTGKACTQQQLDELKQEDQQKYAFDIAARYLSTRQRTRKEIITKLRQKGIEEAFIETTLARLAEYGYIDDEDFAENYAAELKEKYGKRVVYQKLLQKGVEPALARQVTDAQDDRELVSAVAQQLQKRYADEADEYKRKQKLIRALMQKGFEYDDIQRAIGGGDEE